MLVHGFGATPDEMRPLGDALAAAGYAAHGLLLPGHGTTIDDFAAHGREAWQRTVSDAVRRLRSHGHDVVLVGMSMGALLSLTTAAGMPQDVAALVLCGTALEVADRRAAWVARLAGARVVRRLIPSVPKPGGRDISDPGARTASPAYPRIPLATLSELARLQREARGILGSVTQPVLALHGRHDHAVPVHTLDQLRAGLASPWIETHVLERSWHIVTLDVERDLVASLVVDFLARVGSNRP